MGDRARGERIPPFETAGRRNETVRRLRTEYEAGLSKQLWLG